MSRAEIIDGLRRCRDEGLNPGQILIDAAIAEIERAAEVERELRDVREALAAEVAS